MASDESAHSERRYHTHERRREKERERIRVVRRRGWSIELRGRVSRLRPAALYSRLYLRFGIALTVYVYRRDLTILQFCVPPYFTVR